MLLVGFDTLTYLKDYDRSPILVGHHVAREVIEHHLVVFPHARPVKQKVQKQALERQQFIAEEIKKLEVTGLVTRVLHLTWLANPVVVGKANGK